MRFAQRINRIQPSITLEMTSKASELRKSGVDVVHTRLAKTIHWSFIALYAYGIFKQVDDISQLEDDALLNLEVIFASAFLIILTWLAT